MRIIDPYVWEEEKEKYLSELITAYPFSHYIKHEKMYLERFYDILFSIKQCDDFRDIKVTVNPYLKLIRVPFIFENKVENELRGPVFRDVALIPTSFITGSFSIHVQNFGDELSFFKALTGIDSCFSVTNLLVNVEKYSQNEDIDIIRNRFNFFIKKLLNKQLLVVV